MTGLVRAWGAPRLALRIYAVMLLAIACVVAVIVFGRSRRDSPPFPGLTSRYVVETVALYRNDPQALRDELKRARRETPYEITLYGPGGTLIGSNAVHVPAPATTEELRDRPVGTRVERLPHERRRGGEGTHHEAVIILSTAGDHAILRVERPPPRGPDFRADIAMAMLSLGIASLFLATMIARPIARIATAARNFGGGDLTARSDLKRRDEFGQLSQTFDEMADRVTRLLGAQRELLASISHELRTPLSRIRVALDLAAEGDAEAARESLRDIGGDLGELEELVNDVLAIARLDAQPHGTAAIPRLRTQRLVVSALAKKAAARFKTAHPDRLLALDLEEADELGPIQIDADPNLLRRVIENLLENSHKYSPPATAISLSLREEAGQALITISDRGSGIAADDLPHVFEPFFRADRSRTRGTGGVGLGLALSKRVVEAHQGRITIESTIQVGTIVTVALPLAPVDDSL